jgi:hypothetical protein
MATKTKGFFSRIADALDGSQARTLAHIRGLHTESLNKLIEREKQTQRLSRYLVDNFPEEISGNSSEHAVDLAIRLLKASTGRDE